MYRSQTGRLAFAIVSFCCLARPLLGDLMFTADQKRIDQALSYVPNSAYTTEVAKQRAASQPLFIIVPGILGSRLRNESGEVFWGEKGLLKGFHRSDLELRDKPATPEFLDKFIFLGRGGDLYGRLRDYLKFSALREQERHLEFPYDWRQDIRVTAGQLHEFLESKREVIGNRDVIFIAHSMGGLVVRSWYHEFYSRRPEEYAFLRPPRIFFLGTPHYGSAAALVELVGGYGSESNFETITKYFMKDLNDVSFSFVSIFQILPFTQFKVTFRALDGHETTDVDLYSPEIWRQCRWGNVLRDRHHVKEEEFYGNYLAKRLDAARAFRDAMLANADIRIPGSVCFFSDENERTPAALRIRQTKSGCLPEVVRRSPGDGRVIAEYTQFDPSPHPHAEVRHLASEHVALPRDLGFLAYIDEMRTSALVDAILRAQPTSAVYNAFRRAGSLLPVPVDMKLVGTPANESILGFNRFVFAASTGQPLSNKEIAHRLYKLAREAPNYSETALRLYALTVAFDPRGEHAVYAANHTGEILLRHDLWHDALPYAEHSLSLLHTLPRTETEFLATVHLNSGVAYEKSGRFSDALRHYELAGRKAKTNLLNLREKLREHNIEIPATTASTSSVGKSADDDYPSINIRKYSL